MDDSSYFIEADEYCVSNGGHLASVENAFVDGFIQGQASIFFKGKSYWLGGNTMFNPGTWSWTDGTGFTYYNWANGWQIL